MPTLLWILGLLRIYVLYTHAFPYKKVRISMKYGNP